jgi:hypothetical protein
LDRRFWIRDRNLLVRGVENQSGASQKVAGVASTLPDGVTSFAMKKFASLGFHPSRCVKVLKESDGDVGMALERLVILFYF